MSVVRWRFEQQRRGRLRVTLLMLCGVVIVGDFNQTSALQSQISYFNSLSTQCQSNIKPRGDSCIVSWSENVKKCYMFYEDEKLNHLSEPTSAVYPRAPTSLDVSLFHVLHRNLIFVGLNLSWAAPSTVQGFEGYYVQVFSKQPEKKEGGCLLSHEDCAVYYYMRRSWTNKTIRSHECLYSQAYDNSTVITLQSLPKTKNNYIEAYLHYVNTSSDNWTNYDTADNWTTVMIVTIKPQRSSVTVSFTSANQSLPFKSYTVCLITHNSRQYQARTANQKETRVEFENVYPALYEVKLLAGRGEGVAADCTGSGSTEWREAAFIATVNMTTGDIPASNMSLILTSGSVTLAALIAAVLAVLVYRKKLDPKTCCLRLVKQPHGPEEPTDIEVKAKPDGWIKDVKDDTQVTLVDTTQPVLIIYSNDNDSHREVIHRFAFFLLTHCNCSVSLDLWSDRELAQISPIDWIYSRLQSTSTVLIVHSEGGSRRYKARLDGLEYEKLDSELYLDTFIPAIKTVIQDQQRKSSARRVFNVCFNYTGSMKRNVIERVEGEVYEMMTHIERLILLIHNLSKMSKDGVRHISTLNHAQNSNEWADLQTAILAAKFYHRQQPDWFNTLYRTVQPDQTAEVKSARADAGALDKASSNIEKHGRQDVPKPCANGQSHDCDNMERIISDPEQTVNTSSGLPWQNVSGGFTDSGINNSSLRSGVSSNEGSSNIPGHPYIPSYRPINNDYPWRRTASMQNISEPDPITEENESLDSATMIFIEPSIISDDSSLDLQDMDDFTLSCNHQADLRS